jgi:hypothetical protein
MRGLAWILAGIGAFLWGSTALGIAVSLADKGAEGWWVLLPLAAIPVVGVTVAALKQLQRNAPKEERISASESQPSPRASPLTSESEPSRTGSSTR